MEKKYFKVYKDLIVREAISGNIDFDIDVTGIIEYSKSDRLFFPTFFSNTKKGAKVQLWDIRFKDSIPFTDFFSIVKMEEQRDDKTDRNFYKKLIISLKDRLDEIMVFHSDVNDGFYYDPEHIIDYIDLQKCFNDIKKLLGVAKTFQAHRLTRNNNT